MELAKRFPDMYVMAPQAPDLFAAAAPVCPSMNGESYAQLLHWPKVPIWITTAYMDHQHGRHAYILNACTKLWSEGRSMEDVKFTMYLPEELAEYLRQGVIIMQKKSKAIYHLPGLFEFYELYRIFLPLYRDRPEYFYDWCKIGSIYGAPADCLWGGGRVGYGDARAQEVLELMEEYGISARLTFSNSLLKEEHLTDRRCNNLCRLFGEGSLLENGVIVHSDLLVDYLQAKYPKLYLVSSTTKVLTAFTDLQRELAREEFCYVVPDFRLNKAFEQLHALTQEQKDKVEFLCNECCNFGCTDRKRCYENVSRKNLGEDCPDHICTQPGGGEGYRFSRAMQNPGFVGIEDIQNIYLPMGFSNFKLEGRGLGSAMVLEFLLYYMVRPEYQLIVREEIYLDGMLDLF